MPSLDHELLVDLFRQTGELAPVLLELAADIRLDYTQAEPLSGEISMVTPAAFHADTVVLRGMASARSPAAS